jgi:enolase
MPRILANVVGGGAHYTKQSLIAGPSRISGSEGKSIDIQEILLSPNTKDIRKDIASTSIFHKELGSLLGASRQTDEGAWVAPDNLTIKDIMEIVFSLSGYESGIDVAASQLYHNGKYHWKNFWGKAKSFSPKQQKEVVENLAEHFGLFYIEDPLQQDDFKGFAELRKKLADVMICGDDLTATNLNRLKKAVKLKAINAIIIKPNQAGSLIKTKEVFDYAVKYNITPIVSHRSGETMDATIAHLAFAWQAPFVKFGISGNERLAKLNELIKIEKKV